MAELISVTRDLHIPEFSGDGEYLTHYSLDELTKRLGTREDNVTNTLTARLLLLLESKPLVGEAVYHDAIAEVIATYWRDYPDHKDDFIPAYLTNDILRIWRTFCVNYEARTQREPEDRKAKGKLKNYKLKYSRMLTCYSAILWLLACFGRQKTVSPDDAIEMTKCTPTERLEWLLKQPYLVDAKSVLETLLARYERFLETTATEEAALVQRFQNKETSHTYMASAYEFGDTMFEALMKIGSGNRFHRLLVV